MDIEVIKQEMQASSEVLREAVQREVDKLMTLYQFSGLSLDIRMTRIEGVADISATRYEVQVDYHATL